MSLLFIIIGIGAYVVVGIVLAVAWPSWRWRIEEFFYDKFGWKVLSWVLAILLWPLQLVVGLLFACLGVW